MKTHERDVAGEHETDGFGCDAAFKQRVPLRECGELIRVEKFVYEVAERQIDVVAREPIVFVVRALEHRFVFRCNVAQPAAELRQRADAFVERKKTFLSQAG